MTKEEIINRIDTAISEMQSLKNEVQNIPEENDDNSVPTFVDFKNAENVYYVSLTGLVGTQQFGKIQHGDTAALHRRLFKSAEYAEEFQRKTQFIADLLHFKWLYDRDLKVEWNCDCDCDIRMPKYFVFYDYGSKKYFCGYTLVFERSAIYFSTEEIAQKCADWLNSRKDKNNDT